MLYYCVVYLYICNDVMFILSYNKQISWQEKVKCGGKGMVDIGTEDMFLYIYSSTLDVAVVSPVLASFFVNEKPNHSEVFHWDTQQSFSSL